MGGCGGFRDHRGYAYTQFYFRSVYHSLRFYGKDIADKRFFVCQ